LNRSALYTRLGDTGPYRLLQNIYTDLSLAFTYDPDDETPPVPEVIPLNAKNNAETKNEIDNETKNETSAISNALNGKKNEIAKADNKLVNRLKLPHHARLRSLSATAGMVDQRLSQRILRLRSASRGNNTMDLSDLSTPRNRFETNASRTSVFSIKGMEVDTLRTGYLDKRGRVNRSWKKRYFVLDHSTLTYWTKEPNQKGKKKGSLSIATVQSVHRYSIESKSNVLEYHLDIISKDRKLMLKTKDMESQIRWAAAIENISPQIQQDQPTDQTNSRRPRSTVLPLPMGKYSKRRRSNVAVIIVRKLFISVFLFYCLLLNHSFSTNPNKITNCFKLFSLLQLYNYICSMRSLF